jgi:hypothetical protein
MRDYLNHKAKPVLWSQKQIAGLSWELQQLVRAERCKLLLLRFRADWFESRDFLLNIENLLFTDVFDPRGRRYNSFLHGYFSTTLYRLRELYRPG